MMIPQVNFPEVFHLTTTNLDPKVQFIFEVRFIDQIIFQKG